MPDDVVTVVLEGDPTLDDFATALTELQKLLDGIADDEAKGPAIVWTIVSLDAGSAAIGLRGESDNAQRVERVVRGAERVAAALVGSDDVPGSHKVKQAAVRLAKVVNARVPVLRVETSADDFTITADRPANIIELPKSRAAAGAIEGRVQTLSNRGSLRFTLYDLTYDKPVSCYLASDDSEIMRGAWGKLAVVEGNVRRNAQGRPTSVRDVRSVRVIEGTSNEWRRAIGAVPRDEGSPRAEAVIRRLRDAQ